MLIRRGNKCTVLASVYLDITLRQVISPGLVRLVEYCKVNKYDCIIAADSNCHSELYGPSSNPRVEALEEFIFRNNLRIENVGMTLTFVTSRAESCIDITLTLGGVEVEGWQVSEDFNGSDHRTITYSITNGTPSSCTKLTRNWERTDWKLFEREMTACKNYIPELMTDKKLDRLLAKVYSTINKALDLASPLTELESESRNDWFTEHLRNFRKRIRSTYVKMKNGASGSAKELRRMKKQYKKEIRKRKRRTWNKYKVNLDNPKDVARFTKTI